MSLTNRQREALAIIRDFITNHGYPPTLQELAGLMGMKAKSAAHRMVGILVEKGYLEKTPVKARAIRLTHRSA